MITPDATPLDWSDAAFIYVSKCQAEQRGSLYTHHHHCCIGTDMYTRNKTTFSFRLSSALSKFHCMSVKLPFCIKSNKTMKKHLHDPIILVCDSDVGITEKVSY